MKVKGENGGNLIKSKYLVLWNILWATTFSGISHRLFNYYYEYEMWH